MDASQVYGSDVVTANYLRTMNGGLLKTVLINGYEYPPFNDGGITMENAARFANDTQLFMFGDVRGNENPALTALQILFVREHNRKAQEFANSNPTWTDEQLYQEARRWVIALIQHVTEEEYLPVTIGEHFEEYEAFVPTTHPDIFTEFSTGAFRYGHSEVNSWLWRLDSGLLPISQGHLRLKDFYFNSEAAILSAGIEPILRGMAQQVQGEVDTIFVEDLRNYLFGNPGSGGLDLTAINTQRGRDHGLPGFNDFRASFGLARYTSWSQINPSPDVWQALARTYETIDDCDVYVCGLAEVPATSLSNLGETFKKVVATQYRNIRDSDRFWYEAEDYFTESVRAEIEQTTLADIIVRNSPIQQHEIPCFVMATADGCGKTVSAPFGVKYDFLVTHQKKTPDHPLFAEGHIYGFVVNGIEGATIELQRGKNYTFYVQASCNHAFFISAEEEKDMPVPPFAAPYDKAINNMACLHQNPLVYLPVDASTPEELFYHCGLHDFMGGRIVVKDADAEVGTPRPQRPAPGDIVAAVVIPILVVVIVGLIVGFYFVERRNRRGNNAAELDSRRDSRTGVPLEN